MIPAVFALLAAVAQNGRTILSFTDHATTSRRGSASWHRCWHQRHGGLTVLVCDGRAHGKQSVCLSAGRLVEDDH